MLPLGCFEMTKDVRYGVSGDHFLGMKELTYQPGTTSMFFWTIVIQLFQKSGILTTHRAHACLVCS